MPESKTIPTGPRIIRPPEWTNFVTRQPDQGAKGPISEFSPEAAAEANIEDWLDLMTSVNKRVNALGYRRDVTDNWNAYDLNDPAFSFEALESFDCDDLTLTKRLLLNQRGLPMSALRPALCMIPPATYGVGWTGHMVLLVLTPGGDIVLDNIIPWAYYWNEAPYEWVAMVGESDDYWRMVGPRWAYLERHRQVEG